jgi:hypothetical protein
MQIEAPFVGLYDLRLVALSSLIGILAFYGARYLSAGVTATMERDRRAWLPAEAIVCVCSQRGKEEPRFRFGVGIPSMHEPRESRWSA